MKQETMLLIIMMFFSIIIAIITYPNEYVPHTESRYYYLPVQSDDTLMVVKVCVGYYSWEGETR